MRFRLGLLAGAATGYYLGTKAGHARYQQINRALGRLKRSDTVEAVADKARDAVTTAAGRARDAIPWVPHRSNGTGHGTGKVATNGSPNGTDTVPVALPLLGEPTIAPAPKD